MILVEIAGSEFAPPVNQSNLNWNVVAERMCDLGHPRRTGKAHADKFREMEKTYIAIGKHKVGTGDYRMLCIVNYLHSYHSLMHVGSTAWPRCSISHSVFDPFDCQISTNINSCAPRLLPAGGGPPYWLMEEALQIEYLKRWNCTGLAMDQAMYDLMDTYLKHDPVANPIGLKTLGRQVKRVPEVMSLWQRA